MPEISVIVPVYKVEPYLHQCVDSILNQTFRDFEVILVDDGSPDGCPAICDEYAKRDSRVRVIHKKNGGLSSARNAGLDAAKGEYISFIDSDDMVSPKLLETVLPHMRNGADLAAFGYEKVDANGQTLSEMRWEDKEYALPDPRKRTDFIAAKLMQYKIGWESTNRLFRRACIEKYQLRFADNRRVCAEDVYFNLCYCAHAKKIISISDVLYKYLQREDSIMGTNRKILRYGRLDQLAREVLAFYDKWPDCKVMVEKYPLIYYMIMNHLLERASAQTTLSQRAFRQTVLENIPELSFFRENLRQLRHFHGELTKIFSRGQAALRLNYVRFLLNGNEYELKISNWMVYFFSNHLGTGAKQKKKS